jgi:hypothetical protein
MINHSPKKKQLIQETKNLVKILGATWTNLAQPNSQTCCIRPATKIKPNNRYSKIIY